MSSLEDVRQSVILGRASETKKLTQDLLNAGISPQVILESGLISGMDEVGRQFRDNLIFIPDVLMSSRAMHAGIYVLKSLMSKPQQLVAGRVVIGTVAGDLHDIGKNLVTIMLRGKGLEVIDLGIDVTPQVFVQAVDEYKPQVLGMSALLTTTMPVMRDTVEALKQADLRDGVRIIIGGNPVTSEYARIIGADGYASDASKAADLAMKMLQARKPITSGKRKMGRRYKING